MKRPYTRSFAALSAFILVGLLLGGQAEAGQVLLSGPLGTFSVRVTNYKDQPFERVIPQQHDYSCGAAAVATLLTYHYDHPVDEPSVLKAMFATGDQAKIREEGFSLLDMKQYLEAQGYNANGYRTSLTTLAEVGLPAIALTDTDGYLHFVVIKGVDRGRVLIGDPARGLTVVPKELFAETWKSGIFLIVQGRDPRHRVQNFNIRDEWNALPRAPLSMAVSRQGLGHLTLLLPAPNDF
ncbi:MAG: C39 family peptidase [Gammaproteobacteria bacterium]